MAQSSSGIAGPSISPQILTDGSKPGWVRFLCRASPRISATGLLRRHTTTESPCSNDGEFRRVPGLEVETY